jgi:4-amino-4-deoxy-L-arabinose transferase-like glycosyltransferase
MGAAIRAVPRRTAVVFAALTLWLVAIAFVRPLSIDESQYAAATSLANQGLLPYRDFAYLQTPLQPFVFAPLQWLFAGHLLLAMRLANATLGWITILLVYGAARRAGAAASGSLAAAAMLASCQSFVWSVGVARNDVLPALLMMTGLQIIARPARRWSMIAAGLALGLAASAKISYAIPAATVFAAIVWTRDAAERRRALWFAAGVAAGLLPTFLLAAVAPRAFFSEVILFPATAPAQYYTEIGEAWRLGPIRFVRLLTSAAVGPALIAAIEVARGWNGRLLHDPVRRAMLAATVGGLVSASLNKPFHIVYLLPALPPLFVLTALLLSEGERRPGWLKGLWALCIGVGFVPVGTWVVHAERSGIAPALDEQGRSEALGEALRARHVSGPIATLATQYVPDAGADIDPHFAAGPFLYRTRGLVSAKQAREWQIVTRDRAEPLGESPPAAIVTGTYPDVQPTQEAELAAQAKSLGYRPAANAGGFTIWTRQ